MRPFPFFLLLSVLLGVARAETPALLSKAVEKWMGERDNWAFTVLVREFDGGVVKEQRLERYDPSKPGVGRWELISVNGEFPTEQRRAEWQKRKTKKRKNPGKELREYFELDRSTVVKETKETVCYRVPLRNSSSWLFPVDKVDLRVTVNKSTLAIEDVVAGIDEPFRVALGFARVLDVDLDMQIDPYRPDEKVGDPAAANPEGKARVVVNKFGQRVEYAWSNFKRVTPHPDNVMGAAP